ncbi:hypothetical protein [Massilia aquatica]|uniref:DUF2157 domain-containing protein n=1 Tax=Massilia aquatica TaxID=2609000 RepID=A0ABX0M3R1_9BURK|nr:hypothetical protein [Massilia aquatica]NHZ38927.1 hypothetical protein [Massilia aquatica]
MVNACRLFFVCWMLILSMGAFAQAPAPVPARTAADIKTGLIEQMRKDGYLSEPVAKEVTDKYVSPGDFRQAVGAAGNAQINTPSMWSKYMSWVNLIKVVAVICFLVVFYDAILKISKALWIYVSKVPTIAYQLVFLSLTVFGTLRPHAIWPSQAFYVALFCGFANVMLVVWMVMSYEVIGRTLNKLALYRRAPHSADSLLGMLYFGALALMYQSGIFGFFAAVCLSGVFSFSMLYTPGTLSLQFDERLLNAMVFGHLIVLTAYCVMRSTGMQWEAAGYFAAGIEYYCTIALAVALLVGASPWPLRPHRNRYMALFILLAVAASLIYVFLDLKVSASILLCFFVLVTLEWVGYLGFRINMLVGAGALGALLYGIAVLLEKYGGLIVLAQT